MRVLDLSGGFLGLILLQHIVRAEGVLHICTCCRVGLVRDPGGIRTQVCDQAHSALSLDIHALVQLLGDPHGLLSGEIQHLGGFLLQGTGGERNRRLLAAFSVLYIFHHIILSLQLGQDLVLLVFFMNGDFFIARAVKLCV